MLPRILTTRNSRYLPDCRAVVMAVAASVAMGSAHAALDATVQIVDGASLALVFYEITQRPMRPCQLGALPCG